MNWNSWQEFVAMGGYGFYVWGSYGVTLVLIVIELAALAGRRRAIERQTSRNRLKVKAYE
jgi:heme exporter protein D